MHLARRLVLAQPLEGRSAQPPVVRPLDELDLGDQLGPDPDHVGLPDLRHLRDLAKRWPARLERPQLREQLVDVAVGEPGADVAGVLELLASPDAEDERAEPAASPPLAFRVAGDHELLPAVGLDLQPLPRPLPLPVRRVGALGDDPLEPLLLRRAVQRGTVLERLREPDGPIAPVEQRRQPPAPLAQRQIDERLALELEQVEGLVDDRRARLSLLHRGEARPAALVEGADLSVEHAVRCLHRSRDFFRDVREAPDLVVAPAAVEPLGLTAAHVCDRAVAVPLDLEQPAVGRG